MAGPCDREPDHRPFSISDFTFYQGISCILGGWQVGVGKSTLFRSILLNFKAKSIKGRITWKGTVLKKKKSVYRDLTGVVQVLRSYLYPSQSERNCN